MNDTYALRLATEADLESLVSLALEFRDYLQRGEPTAAAFRQGFGRLLRDPSTEFVLAVDAGLLAVGYVQSRYRTSAWNGGVEVELEDVFVAAASRGRGLGRRLVEMAIDHAAARGCGVALLTTNERNTDAMELYARLGFSAERERWQGGRQLCLERVIARR